MLRFLLLILGILGSSSVWAEQVSEFKYAPDSIVVDFDYPIARISIAASGKVHGFLREFGHGPIAPRVDCAGHCETTFSQQEINQLLGEIEEVIFAKYEVNAFLLSPKDLAKETRFRSTETFPATLSFELADYKPKGRAWVGPIRKTFELRFLLAADLSESMQHLAALSQPISAVGQLLIRRISGLACEIENGER